MGKVLIAYYSRTGKTEKMAEYIAEGVRFSGNSAEIKKLADIKNEKELEGVDRATIKVIVTIFTVVEVEATQFAELDQAGDDHLNVDVWSVVSKVHKTRGLIT